MTDYKINFRSKTKGIIASIGIGKNELNAYSRKFLGSNHSPSEREEIELLLNVAAEKFNQGHVSMRRR